MADASKKGWGRGESRYASGDTLANLLYTDTSKIANVETLKRKPPVSKPDGWEPAGRRRRPAQILFGNLKFTRMNHNWLHVHWPDLHSTRTKNLSRHRLTAPDSLIHPDTATSQSDEFTSALRAAMDTPFNSSCHSATNAIS
jgi:hypothetical protein